MSSFENVEINSEEVNSEKISKVCVVIINTNKTFLCPCISSLELNWNVGVDTDFYVFSNNSEMIEKYIDKESKSNIGTINNTRVRFVYYTGIPIIDYRLIYIYLATILTNFQGDYTHCVIIPDNIQLNQMLALGDIDHDLCCLSIGKDYTVSNKCKDCLNESYKEFSGLNKIHPYLLFGRKVKDIIVTLAQTIIKTMNENDSIFKPEDYLSIIVKSLGDYDIHMFSESSIDSLINASIRLHRNELELLQKSLESNSGILKVQLTKANDYDHGATFIEQNEHSTITIAKEGVKNTATVEFV